MACLIIAVGVVMLVDWSKVEELPEPIPAAAPMQIDPYTLRAAQEGDAAAQLRLARALLSDRGREGTRSAEAVHWLRSAAENNSSGAMVELGKLYRSGFGVLQDYDQATKWIRTAAAQGDPEGMLELGRLYRDGVGLPRDPILAYVWFNRAAAALHVEAARARDDVARGLTAPQLKEAQAQSPIVAAGNSGPGGTSGASPVGGTKPTRYDKP
ncbi:MAG TPA: tetratricopeptide repeat protein [Aromatoleum sp.]|uniref:tetratricopeptide repeat protein n=1 Tax=Aromatoleum sp. TaxID=2307007 RepID=UPI002B493414|nr:tetratricopeptide repeat protein [Aromatoleum sp.]HJV28140.1 tetratricopeptide repeat protein [Aromatoleum sp.]